MTDANDSLRACGGPFDIILADPPWRFKSNSKEKPGRNALGHYDCMELEEIKALPVPDVAAKDALLLLWVTVPFLKMGLETAEAWGFKYISELSWTKDRIGTGFWARNRHEPVLICKRGKFPCPKPAPFADSVIEGQQRQHSRKPDRLHEMIAAVSDWSDSRKLEMFARESRPGWTTWGDQTTKFDAASDLAALLDMTPEVEDLLAM